MTQATGISRTLGRAGWLLALVGILVFMAGLFGAPRSLVFYGVTLIVLSLVAFGIEEFGPRN